MRAPVLAAVLSLTILSVPAVSAEAQRGRTEGRRDDGPNVRDWLRTAMRTEEGGVRMGDPEARVKIVQYLAPSCIACGQFTYQAADRLFGSYVSRGRVSIEYRLYYGNGADIAAGLLASCLSGRGYFDMMHNLLGSQREWLGRIAQLTPAQRQSLSGQTPLETARRMVPLLGLDAIARRSGMEADQLNACLTQEGLDRLERRHQAAAAAGVTGTPTFLVNGERVPATTWAELEPLLRGR
jgi:protein-disulfide isomerase